MKEMIHFPTKKNFDSYEYFHNYIRIKDQLLKNVNKKELKNTNNKPVNEIPGRVLFQTIGVHQHGRNSNVFHSCVIYIYHHIRVDQRRNLSNAPNVVEQFNDRAHPSLDKTSNPLQRMHLEA